MPCPGRPLENCGNGNRLSLYSLGGTIPLSTNLSANTLPGGPQTVSAAPSMASQIATGPVPVQSAGLFALRGCLTEGSTGRALAATSTNSALMTTAMCAAFCSSYQFMGVEYSSECYCADSLSTGAVLTTSGCTMTCSGDASSFCGGPNRLRYLDSKFTYVEPTLLIIGSFYQAGASSNSTANSTTTPWSRTSSTPSISSSTIATSVPSAVPKAGKKFAEHLSPLSRLFERRETCLSSVRSQIMHLCTLL